MDVNRVKFVLGSVAVFLKKNLTKTELLTTCCLRTHLSSSKPQKTTDFMQQEHRKWRHMYFDAATIWGKVARWQF